MSRFKIFGTIIRTLAFVVVGLINTIWLKPEDVGTWKNYLGYAFLLFALADGVFLIKNLTKRKRNT